jgi:PhzF family phenazine biosynthesis protein
MTTATALHYAAFTDTPGGGNPAGVVLDGMVLDGAGLDDQRMLSIAATLGYSETAFLQHRGGNAYDVRYFSPLAEVPFCGHATIASAVALAERNGAGDLLFHTRAGPVPVVTRIRQGRIEATLTSVAPTVEPATATLLADVLVALRWSDDELDPDLPPRIAYAGARHLVLVARTRDRLARLDYDFEALRQHMLAADLTTVDLVWRESASVFHARNPFPVGGVVEDPATGAAAAAFGAYLRELRLVAPPATVTIHQGHDMGRPSLLTVVIGESGGIGVTGTAVAMA